MINHNIHRFSTSNHKVSQNKSQYPLVLNKKPKASQNNTDRRPQNGQVNMSQHDIIKIKSNHFSPIMAIGN